MEKNKEDLLAMLFEVITNSIINIDYDYTAYAVEY